MFAKEYSKYYDLFNQDKPYKKEIEFVYQWAKKPEFIFDIGPGTASYWKYYPKSVELFGVDKSRAMENPLNKRGPIICADITKYKMVGEFDCATALFDVLNYIPQHTWWKNIPVRKGGYFIFDIWDKRKVDKDGFSETSKMVDDSFRIIRPINYDGKTVDLSLHVWSEGKHFREKHQMYVYSNKDIEKFCGKEFEIVDIKLTKTWQKWYRLRRK